MPKKISVEELTAKINADPDYVKLAEEKKRSIDELKRTLLKDQESLISDCARVGVIIESVWDLVNTSESYAPAIPVLMDHLRRAHHPRTTEGIVRALITPEAFMAFDLLVTLFKETPQSELKWLIGSAIAETARANSGETLMELLLDESHGWSRMYLPLGLLRLPRDEALAKLSRLPNSPDIDKMVAKAMKLVSRASKPQRKRKENSE